MALQMNSAVNNSLIRQTSFSQIELFSCLARNGSFTEISLPSGEKIRIDSKNRTFTGTMAAAEEAAITTASGLITRVLPGQLTDAHARPVEELLWTIAFHQSGGQLLKQCKRQDVVHFSHWPNLSRLPKTANTVRICALLTRRATSIVLASRILKISEEEVFQIYSAAYYSGISHVLNRQPDLVDTKEHRQASLLGKMMAHLSDKLKNTIRREPVTTTMIARQ